MGLVLSGQAALAAGRLATAVRLLREARAGLMSLETHEFLCRCRLHLTHALGMSGKVTEARQMLAETTRGWHPAYTVMEPDLPLARAWVFAAEGATSEAIAAAHEAAALAGSREQPAYQVIALQTAVCFGDRDAADQLAGLASLVQGPRAHAENPSMMSPTASRVFGLATIAAPCCSWAAPSPTPPKTASTMGSSAG